MNVLFKSDELESLYEYGCSIGRDYSKLDIRVVSAFIKTIQRIKSFDNINILKNYNGLRYEKLKGNLNGYESLRINNQYRLIVRSSEIDNTLTIFDINVYKISKHYE